MKDEKELQELKEKEKIETPNEKFKQLTEEELEKVAGGAWGRKK